MLSSANKKTLLNSSSSFPLFDYQNFFNNTEFTSNNIQALWSTFFSNQFSIKDQNWQLIANNCIQQQYFQEQQRQKLNNLNKPIDSTMKHNTNILNIFKNNSVLKNIECNDEKIEILKKQQIDHIQQSLLQNSFALFMNSSTMFNCFENNNKKIAENNLSFFLSPMLFQTHLKQAAATQQNLSTINLTAVNSAADTKNASITNYFQSDKNKMIDTFLQSSAISNSSNKLLNQEKIQKNLKKNYNVCY